MLDLYTSLLRFKETTIALISCLESEDLEGLEGFMNDRQALIDDMDKQGFDKYQFGTLCKELKLVELNSKMQIIMAEKMNTIKSEIKKIELNKNVNNNYKTNMSVDSIFFNKKI